MSRLPAVRGRAAFLFAEPDFDVDQIVGVENIKLQDPDRLSALALARCAPDIRDQLRPGDLVIGGVNFGFGHPHYPPMIALRNLGVAGVIADSFSPGYWRGEISMGFPQVACPGVLAAVRQWDELFIDWEAHLLHNLTQDYALPIEPLSDADRNMLEAGGLLKYLKRALSPPGASHVG